MKNVYMLFRKQKGMTLIETLVAFSIFTICVSVVIFFIPLFTPPSDPVRQDIHMFFQQIKDDMDYARRLNDNNNRLTIQTETTEIQYRRSGENIIRTKDGRGYEITLQNINHFNVSSTDYGADIQVTDLHGVIWKTSLGYRPSMTGRENIWVRGEP